MTDKILIDRETAVQSLETLQRSPWKNWRVDRSIDSLTAALANAERVEPDTQLCKFYDVATYPDLVAAMEKHITKLQARTPPLTGEAFTQKPRFA